MLDKNTKSELGLAWLVDESRSRVMQVSARKSSVDLQSLAFYAPDFLLKNADPWLVGQEIERADLTSEPVPGVEARSGTSFATFALMHRDILHHIDQGHFKKVVPLICEDIEYQKPLQARMLQNFLSATPGKYNFGFEFAGEGISGFTPELLFEVKGETLHTMALAGTGASDGPSLFLSDKEKLEHNLVIEHIFSALKDFGTVHVGETKEKVFGILKHLHTAIDVQLERPPDFLRFVAALHPTAALGGWPRKEAMNWLETQNFSERRQRFGAPFGYVRENEMCCVVAIRCLQWQHNKAQIFTGCGVVEGSKMESEWRELNLKRQAVHQQLGI